MKIEVKRIKKMGILDDLRMNENFDFTVLEIIDTTDGSKINRAGLYPDNYDIGAQLEIKDLIMQEIGDSLKTREFTITHAELGSPTGIRYYNVIYLRHANN